ncbi:hypothetical protein LWF01_11675 [Saxibacter everestensis]|uniref:Uncharacterized protein n=1 Tax=Saxibacter everestensis TaxID=2909229 RepID=A0ABY8QPA6_9MICO|nr:hypothetical protein LWF01_11675 [Brevibacteriaceae bacterium ZFBP1038]
MPQTGGQYTSPSHRGGPTGDNFVDPRKSKKKKRRLIALLVSGIALLLVIALVAVGMVWVNTKNKKEHGPDVVARDFVSALSQGNYEEASKIAPIKPADGGTDELIKGDAAGKSEAKLSDVKLVSTVLNEEEDEARITISYKVGEEPAEMQLPAKKTGKEDFFWDKWELSGPQFDTFSVNAPGIEEATVNGIKVPLKDGKATLAALPGSYKVDVEGSKYYDGASDTATVGFAGAFGNEPAELGLAKSVNTGKVADEVKKQVEDAVNKCEKTKDPVTKNCPFAAKGKSKGRSAEKDIKKGSVKWDVKSKPSIEVSVSDQGEISFYSSKPGEVGYKADSKTKGAKWSGKGSFSVTGSGKLEGDKISITVDSF